MSRIVSNPYEGVDWDSVDRHKTSVHQHPRTDNPLVPYEDDGPANLIDLYAGDGPDRDGNYLPEGEEQTLLGIGSEGNYNYWPWTDMADRIDELTKSRDPKEVGENGVVAYPQIEDNGREHMNFLWTKATRNEMNRNSRRVHLRTGLKENEDLNVDGSQPMAVLAHPWSYYDEENVDFEWPRYAGDFQQFAESDGLLGTELSNRRLEFGDSTGAELWDHFNSLLGPDRLIWGFGVDDANNYYIGQDVDRGFSTVLFADGEHDVDDQESSRQAAYDAIREGRHFAHQRAEYDPETEEPPTVPTVDEIDVDEDADTITVEASDYDTIEWVSRGSVVGDGETIDVSDLENYVRAELTNEGEGITWTQPFGLDAPNTATRLLE